MARTNRSRVYLGYEDECITDKHRSLVNFTTNKIGGKPDHHNDKSIIQNPQCKLCSLQQLLTLQIYAPLENSRYHRTLYIFACINANCWNQNESWTCLRVQSLEEKTLGNATENSGMAPLATNWLSDADDWGQETNDNNSEQNGNNTIMSEHHFGTKSTEIDETEFNKELSNLRVDDPNANSPTSIESFVGGGAVGRLDSPLASAEIEGQESELVSIDTPTRPQCDLVDLLHEVSSLPLHHSESKMHVNLTFAESFMIVEEEEFNQEVSQHVRDLFLEYQLCNPEIAAVPSSVPPGQLDTVDTTSEKYEKSIPIHGDEMFHYFLSRIQKNPGQIVRYCRDNKAALLLTPLVDTLGVCSHCGSERIFELQVLPTLIPKLRLIPNNGQNFEIEFGTILIFTCSRSCWSSNDLYMEEHVIVQAEKL